MDAQVVEIRGRNRLVDELLSAGLEVARPERDRGIDLIVYSDLESGVGTFIACPIQMKAASIASFGVHQKYAKFPHLILAYVWHLTSIDKAITYALTYDEALNIVKQMGWDRTAAWKSGAYSTTNPGKKLRSLLEPYGMTPEKWREKVKMVAGLAV